MWGSSSPLFLCRLSLALLAAAPTLDVGYLLTGTPPDFEHGVGPLGPSAPMQLPLLGHGVSLHGCSSKVQPLLLTLDEGYLLTTAPPDLERGVAPLGPPAPAQPPVLGRGAASLSPTMCAIAAAHAYLRKYQ